MRAKLLSPALLLVAAFCCLAPTGAQAQGRQNVLLSLMGGVGGSLDQDEAGLGNSAYQLGLTMEMSDRRLLAVRVGRIAFSRGELLGGLTDPNVDYATVGGEYRYDEGSYVSGLFLGLGAYRVEGRFLGVRQEDTVLGVNLGANGLFEINRRFSIVAEVTLHILDSSVAEVFLTGLGGVGIHF